MRNYVKIQKKSLLYSYYAYIDTNEFFADAIFIHEHVKVQFGKVGRRENSQYVVVLCKVWKWEEEKFVSAMEKLRDRMLLLGYSEGLHFFDELGIK